MTAKKAAMAAFSLLFFLLGIALAKPVNQAQAEATAASIAKMGEVKLNFAKQSKSKRVKSSAESESTSLYYIFDTGESGFAIIAGDDIFKPVLGISQNGNFNSADLPPNIAEYLQGLESEMQFALENGQTATPEVSQEWETLAATATAYEQGTYLIQSQWNQTAPFNNMTPIINNSATYTGCVATAMSQLMNYHQYPEHGYGSIPAYLTKTRKIEIAPIDLNTINFNWESMTDNDIANLMFIAGASVEMDYDILGSNGSGAPSVNVVTALRGYFDYDQSISYITRDSVGDSWESILKEQIDLGLPVYYAGLPEGANDAVKSGHAFILDGYDNNGKFHFNWGWGGQYDGWFVSSVLTPGTTHDYSYKQNAIINIMPNQGSQITQNDFSLELARDIALLNANGDTIPDKVLLQGERLVVGVPIYNSGTEPFFGKLAVILENEFGEEIIGEKYASIPTDGFYHPINFYTQGINSKGGIYRVRAVYFTDAEEYFSVNSKCNYIQNPCSAWKYINPLEDVYIVGFYMPKLEVSRSIDIVPEGYSVTDSIKISLSNIGQRDLSNLNLQFRQGVFAGERNIASTILPTKADSLSIAPILGLTAGTYLDTLVISGDNGVFEIFPLRFEVLSSADYYHGYFSEGSLVFTNAQFGYAQATETATFNSVGKLTGLQASFAEGEVFELADAFPYEMLQTNSSLIISINAKSGLLPNIYIDTLRITGDNEVYAELPIKFEVSKAQIAEEDIPIVIGLEGIKDDYAYSVILPEFYSWVMPTKKLSTLGTLTLRAIYNPDPSKYENGYIYLDILVKKAVPIAKGNENTALSSWNLRIVNGDFIFENPSEEIAVVKIYNMNGALSRVLSFANGRHKVSLGALPKGLYIVKAFVDEKR